MLTFLVCLILLPFAICAFVALWPLWLVLAVVFFVMVQNAKAEPLLACACDVAGWLV
jgi:hypothetical protein